MTNVLLALGVFLAAHVIPAYPKLRQRLVATFGRGPYLFGYSLLSLALLAWVILAARAAPYVPLWDPAPWQWAVPLVLMPVSLFLLLAGLLSPNPLSISLKAGEEPGPITGVTRHPVVWSFLIWALAHVPPNGDAVSVLLFGIFAAFALVGFPLLDAKARRRLGAERWREMADRASIVPFGAMLRGRARIVAPLTLMIPALLTIVTYVWFVRYGHRLLIGPDPLAFLPW